ncbi:MAG: 16S rRNA (cytosine(1402)-N(4))-methyltransferase RsmH [Pseudomonadota bacterium]|nr:16S rRNA (cytosine(1402)-N(4))-methyltransferase RsmH [Pseudomonadota bacterium]
MVDETNDDGFQHDTVFLHEAVDALITDPEGVYVDGTFGRGGHSRLLLQKLGANGRLLVIDKDPEAIAVAEALREADGRVRIAHGSFADLARFVREWPEAAREQGAGQTQVESKVNGVLLDLGVSSPQLDDARRGFSFSHDGPLDMRMNNKQGISAAEWIATAAEEEIARVIYEYGEEKFSRRMARAIVAERARQPITTTKQLADIVAQANPAWERHKHPATRAFQGIRIFINDELRDLETVLAATLDVLAAGGRMAIISFHSLEDRIVKQFMQKHVRGDDFPPGVPVTSAQLKPRLKLVGKALKTSDDARARNVRARSAVLRVAEKLA